MRRAAALVGLAILTLAASATSARAQARPSLELSYGKPDVARPYGFRDLLNGIGTDQRDFWSYPVTGSHRSQLRIALPLVAGIGVLSAVDEDTAEAVDRGLSKSDVRASREFSDVADDVFSYGLPLTMWSIGRIAHRPRLAETGGLMTQALVSSGVEVTALKALTGRTRPFGKEMGEFGGPAAGGDSFPSGHTTSAFAVATVLAGRTDRKWVKWTAYGVAGLIAATRITGERHFPGDVLAGAGIGFAQGRITLKNRRLQGERERLELSVLDPVPPGSFTIADRPDASP
jgi:hypothetical protein